MYIDFLNLLSENSKSILKSSLSGSSHKNPDDEEEDENESEPDSDSDDGSIGGDDGGLSDIEDSLPIKTKKRSSNRNDKDEKSFFEQAKETAFDVKPSNSTLESVDITTGRENFTPEINPEVVSGLEGTDVMPNSAASGIFQKAKESGVRPGSYEPAPDPFKAPPQFEILPDSPNRPSVMVLNSYPPQYRVKNKSTGRWEDVPRGYEPVFNKDGSYTVKMQPPGSGLQKDMFSSGAPMMKQNDGAAIARSALDSLFQKFSGNEGVMNNTQLQQQQSNVPLSNIANQKGATMLGIGGSAFNSKYGKGQPTQEELQHMGYGIVNLAKGDEGAKWVIPIIDDIARVAYMRETGNRPEMAPGRYVQEWRNSYLNGDKPKGSEQLDQDLKRIGLPSVAEVKFKGPQLRYDPKAAASKLGVNSDNFNEAAQSITSAFNHFGINDPDVIDYALATAKVETASTFKPINEYKNANGSIPVGWNSYGGGSNYHGRGYIQLTHDYNYSAANEMIKKELGEDPNLVANPEQANNPKYAGLILAHFFNSRPDLIQAIKDNNLAYARRRVQGGSAGLEDVNQAYWALRGLK
jgi:predicted chitinase